MISKKMFKTEDYTGKKSLNRKRNTLQNYFYSLVFKSSQIQKYTQIQDSITSVSAACSVGSGVRCRVSRRPSPASCCHLNLSPTVLRMMR